MNNSDYRLEKDSIPDLRQLYTPLQPTVTPSAEEVHYLEILPDAALQPFIFCYWQLKTTQTLSEQFNYRVVADGCIDVFFELGNPAESFVMGFCKRYTEFPLENSFNYVGIRFLPTMFPQLLRINAAELSDRFLELHEVVPDVSAFISRHFNDEQTADEIKNSLDRYFLELITTADIVPDLRLYRAIRIILRNFGVLDVERDLETGISPRQLRRLFEFYVGATPKTFSRVVRFQNILKAKPSRQGLRQNKLFLDAGYYDQAHFIKEFRNFYGVTPNKAFGR